ncbi:translation initiation factor, aIF-2BI family protein [Chondrocystis sp. NIES-4102]|nr:translation initiation factor, aIF-2BI family protein [Chondrocystis sp. NIES-4102]
MILTSNEIYPVVWQDGKVLLIDQTRLPGEYSRVAITRSSDMAQAIKTMIVRGAPAIGVAAAYGMYLGALESNTSDRAKFLEHLEQIAQQLRQTRPTAVNLFWAISRMLKSAYEDLGTIAEIKDNLLITAQTIQAEDLATCRAIGEHGLNVLPKTPEKLRILTHCNTGSLATAGYGTALGVIRSAWRSQRLARVYADETRPRLQGAKLTAWECVQENIPVTVITDSMAAHCMQRQMVDVVIVGADRITANGDVANKIGTYSVAIAAKAHQIPFYVAAPFSTIDFKLGSGNEITIEERSASEIYHLNDSNICVEGAEFYNPAFDITPANLITGIITEKGTIKPDSLADYSNQMV